MKKIISVFLVAIIGASLFNLASYAEDVYISDIQLIKAEYYEAVKTEEQIRDSVVYVEFTATLSDGSEVSYNTTDDWSNGAEYEVNAYIQNEVDEDYGEQQSLYIVIDGQEFWAGYTNVEVNKFKAIFRIIVTWEWVKPIVAKTTDFFSNMFSTIVSVLKTAFNNLLSCIDSCKSPCLCEIFHCK